MLQSLPEGHFQSKRRVDALKCIDARELLLRLLRSELTWSQWHPYPHPYSTVHNSAFLAALIVPFEEPQ